jgi:hypothetical protein
MRPLLAVLFVVLLAAPAQAQTVYRDWMGREARTPTIFTASMPNGFNRRSKTPCCFATLSRPAFW